MFAFAAISGALVIHARMSSFDNFAPTPSSTGPFLLPAPFTRWQTVHFFSVSSFSPSAAVGCCATAGTTQRPSIRTINVVRIMCGNLRDRGLQQPYRVVFSRRTTLSLGGRETFLGE